MSDLPPHTAFLLDALPASRRLRVVDVGANPLSDPPYAALLRGGGCEVTGFEPQWDAFTQLRDAAGPNETYHHAALGRGGAATLHVTEQSGLTSLYPTHAPSVELIGWGQATRLDRTEVLQTVRMDDVPDLPPQDVLKIDVQGAELDVIARGHDTLARAVVIVSEVRLGRLYDGEPMFGAFDTAMRAAGFSFVKFLHLKSRRFVSSQTEDVGRRWSRSQAIDGDAVYVRDPTRPDRLDIDQICHLALAADAVFASPDLTLLCLDWLAEREAVAPDCAARYADLGVPQKFRAHVREAAE